MALNQLHRVVARPVGLADAAKTQINVATAACFGGLEVPNGVLAGTVASIDSATGLYKKCLNADTTPATNANLPLGLFGIDAAGEPNEQNKPKNHGKITLVSLGFHEVTIFEDDTYLSGDALYASANGYLTKVAGAATVVVAYVEKAPTTSDPVMIIKLVI